MNIKNPLFIFLPLISLFLSCANNDQNDVLATEIESVETNLMHPVYIAGDSMWTIEDRMKHYGVPGVSIAVIKDGKIAFSKTYGVEDKDSKSPVTRETLFQAGSISKTITAYGALKLVELNRIELDEDINTYLQTWKLPKNEFTKVKKATLRNLLNHSGGITVDGFLGYSPDLPVPTLVDVLEGTSPANSPPVFANQIPEERFRYSGGGYTIIQQMMIDVGDKPFPILMEELVLQPLNMSNSTFDQPLQSAQLKLAATGYLQDGAMVNGKRFTFPEMAAAGLWTTAEDVAKFVVDIQQTLEDKSNTVLSQTSINEMLTPLYEGGGPALGVFLSKIKNEIYFFHNGWVQGFSSEFVAHKNKGYGVVVLTNANHPDFIAEVIRSVAFTYQWDDYIARFRKLELIPDVVEKIVGRYRLNDENIVEIYSSDNRLFRKNLGEKPVELIRVSDTSYISRNDNEKFIQFSLNPTNENYDLITRFHSGYLSSSLSRMKGNEKIPLEFLEMGDFDQALEAYQKLKAENPENPAILEGNLNELGYHFLDLNNVELSQDIFKINTILYPNSPNVYDSYAEASMKIGDLDLAITNFKTSLSLDSTNKNVEVRLEELQKRMENKQ